MTFASRGRVNVCSVDRELMKAEASGRAADTTRAVGRRVRLMREMMLAPVRGENVRLAALKFGVSAASAHRWLHRAQKLVVQRSRPA